jgi:hypothetical protein
MILGLLAISVKFDCHRLFVYFSEQSDNALKTAIKDDYKKNKQCKITIAAAETASRAGGWGLAKKSPHLENFNQGYILVQLIIARMKHSYIDIIINC